MQHLVEHEERIIGYALADSGDPAVSDETPLLEQLVGCEECLAYGYRAVAELPLFLRATGAGPKAVERLQARSAQRLDGLLRDAMGRLGEMDAEALPKKETPKIVKTSFAWLRLRPRVVRPAFGLAVAAGLVGAFLTLTHKTPTALDEGFAKAQLEQAREALPTGFSFSPGAPPAPFWRGYSMGLLFDVEAAEIENEAVEEVLEAVIRSMATQDRTGGWSFLKEKGCQALASSPSEREACRQGISAYRLRRELDNASNRGQFPEQLLRSDGAVGFLTWAKAELRENPSPAAVKDKVVWLENRRANNTPPDEQEASEWAGLIQWFFQR
jgi:hypothetical protein